jgi:hypothetical protein
MISPILDEISLLSSGFESFSIVFSRRGTNQAARSCAKFACTLVESISYTSTDQAFTHG